MSAKGKVFVKTTKGIYPYSFLRKAQDYSASKQLKKEATWAFEQGLVEPPYSPDTLLALYESNSVLFRCVNQLAADVAGLGWTLQLKENQKESVQEKERITQLLHRPNEEDYFRTIIRRMLKDWGSVGWCCMEVVRNLQGDIVALYHVPAHTIRVHKSQTKYCQIRGTKKIWFKKFGFPADISLETGKEGKYPLKTRANELIFYRNDYAKSDYYGVPNFISTVGDVLGLMGLRDYNLAFFENYGVPSAIIILEGDWEEDSDRRITEFLNREIRGTENAHKTLVVTQPDNCKFTYIPINSTAQEASFRLYEQNRRDSILIAYSMPPERVGIRVVGKLGGNVAEEATRVYVKSVVEPLQNDIEDIINGKLLQSDVYQFKFEDIDLRNRAEEVDQIIKQVQFGILTPNEARVALGMDPYDEGNKFYIASNLIESGESEPEGG